MLEVGPQQQVVVLGAQELQAETDAVIVGLQTALHPGVHLLGIGKGDEGRILHGAVDDFAPRRRAKTQHGVAEDTFDVKAEQRGRRGLASAVARARLPTGLAPRARLEPTRRAA